MKFIVNISITDKSLADEDPSRDSKLQFLGATIRAFMIQKDPDQDNIVKYRLILGPLEPDIVNHFLKGNVNFVEVLGNDGTTGTNNGYQLLLKPHSVIVEESVSSLKMITVDLVSSKISAIMKDTSFSIGNSSNSEDYETTGTARRYLNTLLAEFEERYKIGTGNSGGKGDTTFTYRKLFLPSMSGLDMIRTIHNQYHPALYKVPYIFDEANVSSTHKNLDYLTDCLYKEIDLANNDSFPKKNIKDLVHINTIVSIGDYVDFFGGTEKEDIENTTFIVKTSGDTKQVIYEANEITEDVEIPYNNGGSLEFETEKVSRNKIVKIDAAYDQGLFLDKLSFLKKHLDLKPKLVFYTFSNAHPSLLDFNVWYSMEFKDNSTKFDSTPYRLIYTWYPDQQTNMEFNDSMNYKLDIEAAFYVCENVIK